MLVHFELINTATAGPRVCQRCGDPSVCYHLSDGTPYRVCRCPWYRMSVSPLSELATHRRDWVENGRRYRRFAYGPVIDINATYPQ